MLRLDMKHAEAIGGVVLKLPSLQAVWHFDASCVYAEAAVVRVGTAKPHKLFFLSHLLPRKSQAAPPASETGITYRQALRQKT